MEPVEAPTHLDESARRRADKLFHEHQLGIWTRIDLLFSRLMIVQWLAGIAAAIWIAPRTWTGTLSQIHPHVLAAVFLGGAIISLPVYLAWHFPGKTLTRQTIGIAQMLFSALLIHLTGGRIETHFHVFGSLALLAFYRDWKVLLAGTVIVAADHFLRGEFWPQSVYGISTPNHWRWLEHAGWVVFEDVFLFAACFRGVQEMRGIAERRALLENALEAVRIADQRTSSIIETALDAVIGIDDQSLITGWNTQAEKIFGWKRDEVIGRSLSETIVPEALRDAQKKGMSHFLKTGEGNVLNRRVEMSALCRDGRQIPVEIAIAAIPTANSFVFSAFIRDITERKRAESEIRQAMADAESANRAKSEFLAHMSHEIRTPLNGVIGMTDLLLGTDLTERQRKYTNLSKASADALLNVINDILDFSKIEAGKLELENVPFDIRQATEDIAELLAPKAAEKNLELVCRVSPSVNSNVRGDPGRFRQILINLINNAIKFTDTGEVAVHATQVEETSEFTVFRIAVTDTGIGIPPDRMARLFNSFSQVDASTTRRYGGTGLGLVISKQLVEAMGGKMGVESQPRKGSTFWFTVRLQRSHASQPARPIPGNLAGLRALAVDDNATNRAILQDQLTCWGMRVELANNAKQALQLLHAAANTGNPFRLLLLDMIMPEIDGMQLARTIKETHKFDNLTTLLLTSLDSPVSDEQMNVCGLAGHILKPVRQSVLLDSIMKAIVPSQVSAGVVETSKAPAESASAANSTVPAKILLAEDNAINQIVASEILKRQNYQVDVVDNGRKAVEAAIAGQYDLILMDVQMPEIDGLEATRQIRAKNVQRPAGGPVPIVALTANAIKGDHDRCLEAGMNAYTSKPINQQQLLDTIRPLIATLPAAPPANPTPVSAATANPIDAVALLDRCLNSSDLALTVLDSFHREATRELQQIEQTLLAGDLKAVGEIAHSLKGAAGTLAADDLAHVTARLEKLSQSADLDNSRALLASLQLEVNRCINYLPTLRDKIKQTATAK